MSSITASNLTSGFIDLATFDEAEKYLYGGPNAITFFVRETKKATWFTLVPVALSRASGQPQFNQEWSVTVSRSGDYLTNAWLRVTFPSVTLAPTNRFGDKGRLRWTRNLLINLINQCAFSANDLIISRFDNWHLDFWSNFTVPAGKINGFNNLVGNINELIQPHRPGVPLPSVTLNLPLPFFFSRNSPLPTASLPYNELRLTFAFRGWQDLLILDECTSDTTSRAHQVMPSDLSSGEPQLQNVQVWGTYAIVSNDERRRMGANSRDILIEQAQTAPLCAFTPSQNPSYDLRFSHSIKAIFFACRNKTCASEWSNYSAASPVVHSSTAGGEEYVDFTPAGAVDPIASASLIYENTCRLNLGSDYFSLIQPFFYCPVVPIITGLHVFNYSLDLYSQSSPCGSTNFGKLTNVSIIPVPSKATLEVGDPGSGAEYPQTYDFVCTALNWNVIRVSGGALGFPVL